MTALKFIIFIIVLDLIIISLYYYYYYMSIIYIITITIIYLFYYFYYCHHNYPIHYHYYYCCFCFLMMVVVVVSKLNHLCRPTCLRPWYQGPEGAGRNCQYFADCWTMWLLYTRMFAPLALLVLIRARFLQDDALISLRVPQHYLVLV